MTVWVRLLCQKREPKLNGFKKTPISLTYPCPKAGDPGLVEQFYSMSSCSFRLGTLPHAGWEPSLMAQDDCNSPSLVVCLPCGGVVARPLLWREGVVFLTVTSHRLFPRICMPRHGAKHYDCKTNNRLSALKRFQLGDMKSDNFENSRTSVVMNQVLKTHQGRVTLNPSEVLAP